MGIRAKLIVFLLSFGFLILGALIWSNQFVLHKTMLHYVDQRDQQRLERLKNNLEVYFQYEPIIHAGEISERDWQKLLHLSHRIDLVQMPSLIPLVVGRELRRRPPPPDDFESRVSLMSPDGKIIYGPPMEKACIKMPVYENGTLIAQLGYHPLQELIEQADIEFAQSQLKMLTIGAGLITLLALIILWPLANHFLAPIRQLNRAMHQLAGGDLGGRLDVQRKDELGTLQRDFNHLATTLEAAQNSRNHWIADISHELRTPLTVLNGSIEAMCDGVRPLTQENLRVLQQEVSILQRLIEDLYQLSLSDVGAIQYRMQSVDLVEIIRQAVTSQLAKAEAKDLQIEWKALPDQAWIYGDASRLNQLLSNLLQNSIDYTDARDSSGKPGKICLSLQEQDQAWRLKIVDSSPGVSADELPHLTERFYRTEPSRNRRTGGAGLGLAMVNQIVQAHQGHLQLQPSEIGGLQVLVELPKELNRKESL